MSHRIFRLLTPIALALALQLVPGVAHAHGGGGDLLTPHDVEEAVERAREIFRIHKGTWLLNRACPSLS